ncbi:MAG: oligosaccharide flippase family protein, partial [Alphaproteobacteria bacterium]|nr:oligosaccharide flippase family protein [Alphaproteobacteria bacterium]
MVTSFRLNVAANFVGQFYTTAIGILLVPLYLRFMGTEAYGLVGFFTMLQGWFYLLDIGLTPTIAREAARYRGGKLEAEGFRTLVRALEVSFWTISAIAAFVLALSSGLIATKWLHVEKLPLTEVNRAVVLIVTTAGLRLVSSFYRSTLSGFEKFVWLSSFGIASSTARFVFVLPFMIFFGATPTRFFGYQLVVALLEVAVLAFEAYRFIPRVKISNHLAVYVRALQGVAKFSMTIAFTG